VPTDIRGENYQSALQESQNRSDHAG